MSDRLTVKQAAEGSPAHRAGLRGGDRLVAREGKASVSASPYSSAVKGSRYFSHALRLPFLVMSLQTATVPLRLEAFDPIRRAPGTFVLGVAAMCSVVWLLFVLLNESHMSLFVGLQIGFQAFALNVIWRLCERRAARHAAPATALDQALKTPGVSVQATAEAGGAVSASSTAARPRPKRPTSRAGRG